MAKPWLLGLRLTALVGLGASAALLADYVAAAPTFCSATGGCAAVRASRFGSLPLTETLSLPLPLVGVVGFAALFACALRFQRAAPWVASLGALSGAFLVFVQVAVLQHYCWLCLVADGAALASAPLAWASLRAGCAQADPRLAPLSWWGLFALALSAPLLWPFVREAPPVPASVLAYYRPGKLNVVELADFQCPACRRFHPILKRSLAPYGDQVRFVRLNKPLDSHRYARPAARAAICAEEQGKGEAMADALFTTEDLSPDGIARAAVGAGLDLAALERCTLSSATAARVERESGVLSRSELEGLPTTYIGGKRLVGVQGRAAIDDALARARRDEGNRGLGATAYAALVALSASLLVRLGLRRGTAPERETGSGAS